MRIRTTQESTPTLFRRYCGRDLDANPLRVVVAGGDGFSTPEISAALDQDPIEIFETPRADDLECLLRDTIDGRQHGTLDAVICDGRRDARRALALAARLLDFDRSLPVLILIGKADSSTGILARLAGFCVLRAPFADFELRDALLALGGDDDNGGTHEHST